MQHFSAVMRLVPMTPKMWLELVPITPMPCAIFAAVRQFSLGLARCCLCFALAHVLLWNCVPSTSCGSTGGWVGEPNFFQTSEGRCILQPAVLKAHTGTSQCGAACARGVVETCSLLPQALCRQSFVAVGAAFWCWLGTWLYMQHSSAAVGLVPMTPGDVA